MAAIIDYRGKSPAKAAFGIPLITAKIVKNGRILAPDEFIAPEQYDEWMRRGLPQPGDVLMTTEAPLGEIAQLDGTKVALAQRLITLRGKEDVLDNKFLKFLMQSRFVQQELKARATGTTVQGIRQSELRKVRLPIPPIKEQRAVAEVLGALDDKIELNREINETLEAMASAVFKSWFVDFDPVRSKVEGRRPIGMDTATGALFPTTFQDSPLGKIPRGWKKGVLGDIAENPRRGLQPQNVAAGTPYIALDRMPRRSISLCGWGVAEEAVSNKFQFLTGEFLFGKLRPYFHKVGVAPVDGVCSTDILVIRPREDRWYGVVLGHLFSDEFIAYTNAGSTGTKMPRTSWPEMARYEICLPDSAVSEALNRLVLPMIAKIRLNILESRTLAAMRDTLLPKLISGEIRLTKSAEATA